MFKEFILEPMIEIREAEGLEGKYNLLNILYLRVLDREESLNRNQEVLESNRQRLMLYKMYIESLEGNNTTLIGEIRSTAVKPKKINTTVIAGIAGLIMALFIAFFMEYIEESKLRRKGKRQVNLA
jgi:capsular polysaccharide biosynthesis protein